MAVREVIEWGPTEVLNRTGEFSERTEVEDLPTNMRMLQAAIRRWEGDAIAADRSSAGTGAAYTLDPHATLPNPATGPPHGAVFSFRIHAVSAVDPTLAVDGGPAWPLVLPNGNRPTVGHFPAGHVAVVRTDNDNNRYIVLQPLLIVPDVLTDGNMAKALDGVAKPSNPDETTQFALQIASDGTLTIEEFEAPEAPDAGPLEGVSLPSVTETKTFVVQVTAEGVASFVEAVFRYRLNNTRGTYSTVSNPFPFSGRYLLGLQGGGGGGNRGATGRGNSGYSTTLQRKTKIGNWPSSLAADPVAQARAGGRRDSDAGTNGIDRPTNGVPLPSGWPSGSGGGFGGGDGERKEATVNIDLATYDYRINVGGGAQPKPGTAGFGTGGQGGWARWQRVG